MAAPSYFISDTPHMLLNQPRNLPLQRRAFQFCQSRFRGSHSHVVKNSSFDERDPASGPTVLVEGTAAIPQLLRPALRLLLKELRDESSPVHDVPLLSAPEAIERLRRSRESNKRTQRYLAMYSSVFGGIIMDEGAMLIPMDDHMVHRGHGVFDTAAIVDGFLYELEQHLDRFLGSANKAKIKPPFDKESTKQILIQTVSASCCRNGSLRYWLSSGPGDFQLSPSGCHQSALYAIVIQDQSPPNYKGIKVITSSVPIKPRQFAIMKSVNYLPNVLSKMEAEENGAYAAIWLDQQVFVAEGPNMNVTFVTQENELLMPPFDKILNGCTAKRVLELAGDLVKKGKVRGVQVRDVSVEEEKQAQEMMLIGSGVAVRPVLQWDDQVIGNETESLRNLILEDMKKGPSTVRTVIPY